MSSYTTYDFAESLAGGSGINGGGRISVDPKSVKRVIAAWGDSPEGYGSWEGGFLLELTDGRYCYLTGWCDTTGWGCQDGSDVTYYDQQPDLATLDASVSWDLDPADLNKWLADGAKEMD